MTTPFADYSSSGRNKFKEIFQAILAMAMLSQYMKWEKSLKICTLVVSRTTYCSVAYGCYVCWVFFLQLYASLIATCMWHFLFYYSFFSVSCHLTNKNEYINLGPCGPPLRWRGGGVVEPRTCPSTSSVTITQMVAVKIHVCLFVIIANFQYLTCRPNLVV